MEIAVLSRNGSPIQHLQKFNTNNTYVGYSSAEEILSNPRKPDRIIFIYQDSMEDDLRALDEFLLTSTGVDLIVLVKSDYVADTLVFKSLPYCLVSKEGSELGHKFFSEITSDTLDSIRSNYGYKASLPENLLDLGMYQGADTGFLNAPEVEEVVARTVEYGTHARDDNPTRVHWVIGDLYAAVELAMNLKTRGTVLFLDCLKSNFSPFLEDSSLFKRINPEIGSDRFYEDDNIFIQTGTSLPDNLNYLDSYDFCVILGSTDLIYKAQSDSTIYWALAPHKDSLLEVINFIEMSGVDLDVLSNALVLRSDSEELVNPIKFLLSGRLVWGRKDFTYLFEELL